MHFKITGRIVEKESKRPLNGLLVRAYDKDLFFSDLLGSAITSGNGSFMISYDEQDFAEIFEKRPDIYLVVYSSDEAKGLSDKISGTPLFSTECYVKFRAGRSEDFTLKIPRINLGKDAPPAGFVPTPKHGPWKDKIREFIRSNGHPFRPDPKKGFSRPLLECNSNFGPEIRHLDVGNHGDVTVQVTNNGNHSSHFAYVGIYEGPRGYDSHIQDYRLTDYKVITIHSSETVSVKLKWDRTLESGRIVGICYDPLLDPRGFNIVEQYNRHITSIHYRG